MTDSNVEGIGTTRRVPIRELHHYPGNARTHDLGAIADSLDHHGLYRPVVVQQSTMRILAGNGTVEAAREILGWAEVDAYVVDVDDDAALRINLVDNQTQALGGTDPELLAAQLRDLAGDYTGTAFTPGDLKALDAQLARLAEKNAEPEDEPEPMEAVAFWCPNCGHELDPAKVRLASTE